MRRLVLIVAAALTFSTPCFAVDDQPAKPIEQTPPGYPEELQDTEGVLTVGFTIDASGAVKDARVLEALPPTLFDDAALAAVKNWRYAPRMVDGQPVEQTANRIRLHFKPGGRPLPVLVHPVNPSYPKEAYKAKLEGSVKLKFDVDVYGLAENIEVVSSLPDSTFDKAAVAALHRALFKPVLVDGKPTVTQGITTLITFSLADYKPEPEIKFMPPKPEYPWAAQRAGYEGYCRIINHIRPDGTVESSEIENVYPVRYFESVCLDFSKKIIYEADEENNQQMRSATVQYRFVFSDLPHPKYTPKEQNEWAKFEFTRKANGQVTDVKVLDSSVDLPYAWVRSAIEQLSKTKFAPQLENGVAVDAPHQSVVIRGPDR